MVHITPEPESMGNINTTGPIGSTSGWPSTSVIAGGVAIVIMIIVIITVITIIVVILVFRSKQKKSEDLYVNVPNSIEGGNKEVEMAETEMSGEAVIADVVKTDAVDYQGGLDEKFRDIISGGTDTDDQCAAIYNTDTIYSAVGAGESDQLYSRLGDCETKQQNPANHIYSEVNKLALYSIPQPVAVIEAVDPVYSNPNFNREHRYTSSPVVNSQMDKIKNNPNKPYGATGAPEVPRKSKHFLKFLESKQYRDVHSKTTKSSPSKLSALSNQSDSLNINPIYDSVGGEESTHKEQIKSNRHAELGEATGQTYDAVYSESLNPSSFLGEVTPAESQDSDGLCPYSPIYSVPLVMAEKPLEVTKNNIQKVKILGSGNFGEVLLAKTVGLSYRDLRISQSTDTNVMVQVAVKMLKPDASASIKKRFEKEYRFMSRLSNPNVIRLLGICVTDTHFIMMEYMENGDLNQFLKKFKTVVDGNVSSNVDITRFTLVYICTQIASAMKYLTSKNFVHRDLATRNCLVGENFHVKISDFGMSHSLYESHYYIIQGQATLPIRWMATECFYGKFSAKTDVWAFGVTMWEVFILSKHEPYYDMEDMELVEDACKGPNRTLLSCPQECPVNVYQIMTRCWVHEPRQRATFEELYKMLSTIN